MTRTQRVLLAMLVAPLATPLFVVCSFLIVRGKLTASAVDTKWIFLGGAYALSYTVGIPIYLLARRRAWRTALAYMGGGFLIGPAAVMLGLVIILLLDAFMGRLAAAYPLLASPLGLLVLAIPIGFFTTPIGLLFWLIERPDQCI